MALSIAQKSAIRRHLAYPVIGLIRQGPGGASLASGFSGYRYFQAYGALEYKMNNLNPDEEARLLGNGMGGVAFVGNPPNPGDSVSVVLSGGPIPSPQTLTAVFPTPAPGGQDGRLWFANELAVLALGNSVLTGIGMTAVAPYGTGPFAQAAVPLPEVAFTCPGASFSLSTSFSGACAATVTATGALLPPSTSLDGVTTIYGYLPILDGLENSWLTASQNMDTKKADVWESRVNEAGMRRSLYEQYKQQMGDFLGIPIYIDANARPMSTGAMRFA
jgi:hypothetical protein